MNPNLLRSRKHRRPTSEKFNIYKSKRQTSDSYWQSDSKSNNKQTNKEDNLDFMIPILLDELSKNPQLEYKLLKTLRILNWIKSFYPNIHAEIKKPFFKRRSILTIYLSMIVGVFIDMLIIFKGYLKILDEIPGHNLPILLGLTAIILPVILFIMAVDEGMSCFLLTTNELLERYVDRLKNKSTEVTELTKEIIKYTTDEELAHQYLLAQTF